MARNWLDMTYFTPAEFDTLVAARKAKALRTPIP